MGVSFSDAALEQINNFKRLKRLDLDQSLITDAGLEHLKGLASLRSLDLRRTQVTDAGVRKFQSALPDCTIELDDWF